MDSTPEQAAEGLAVVRVLAAVLERLVCANSHLSRVDPGQVTKFHSLKVPAIGIPAYLERIHKFASCSTECYVLALIYIDRLIQQNSFLLTELNVHRVVITAILLAAKFFDDSYYNNAYYAKVGGILVSEMNGLEVDFLFRINFSLHVNTELFNKYQKELFSRIAETTIPQAPSPIQQPKLPLLGKAPQVHLNTGIIHQQTLIPKGLPNFTSVASHITPSPPPSAAQTAMMLAQMPSEVYEDALIDWQRQQQTHAPLIVQDQIHPVVPNPSAVPSPQEFHTINRQIPVIDTRNVITSNVGGLAVVYPSHHLIQNVTPQSMMTNKLDPFLILENRVYHNEGQVLTQYDVIANAATRQEGYPLTAPDPSALMAQHFVGGQMLAGAGV
mmetsp:Transcript_10723/g.16362  ORF Transcript_10723/g.16362 Transcript_10723/m.16362 type:complete len:385 (-) Transcript_10723:1267-2421(-)